MKEDITKKIDDLNEDLKVRQESIDLLKGRLKSQITSFNPIAYGGGGFWPVPSDCQP